MIYVPWLPILKNNKNLTPVVARPPAVGVKPEHGGRERAQGLAVKPDVVV